MHCSDRVQVRSPTERLPDEAKGTLQLPIQLHLDVTLLSHITPHGNFLLLLLTFLLYKWLPAPQPKSWSMQDRKDRNGRAEPNSLFFFLSSVAILAALATALWFPRSSFYLQETAMPPSQLCLSQPLTSGTVSLAFYHSLPNVGC